MLALTPPPTVQEIQGRLEWAGGVLLALNLRPGGPQEFRSNWPTFAQEPQEAYGYTKTQLRPPIPPAVDISEMDAVLAWIEFIPHAHQRRVVGARALVSPVNQKYVFPWLRIAKMLGTDRTVVKTWHRQGLVWILRRGKGPS